VSEKKVPSEKKSTFNAGASATKNVEKSKTERQLIVDEGSQAKRQGGDPFNLNWMEGRGECYIKEKAFCRNCLKCQLSSKKRRGSRRKLALVLPQNGRKMGR